MSETKDAPDAVEILTEIHSFSALDTDVPTWFEPRVKAAMGAILAERQRHEKRLQRQTDWYQQRFNRLRRWVTEEVQPLSAEVAHRYFSICANGSADPHEGADWTNTVHGLTLERDRLRNQLRQTQDCGQDTVCATPPGCLRHWEERNRELADQLRRVERERDAARTQDVILCLKYCDDDDPETEGGIGELARRLLAAIDEADGCPECHMPGHHKMSCSRGGSKGARLFGSPIDESDKEPTP